MKKYLSFFRMRFLMGVQYRAAAAAGVTTQFAWGCLEILVYRAFYQDNAAAFPMSFQAVVNYIWLQQTFLMLFMAWRIEGEILSGISDGNIAYELCRPIRIYDMWFARTAAYRVSGTLLRCIPVFTVTLLIPAPYGLSLPPDPQTAALFLVSLLLGLLVMTGIGVLMYVCCCFTISIQGIRIFYGAASELLSGQIVPLPFMPEAVRRVVSVLPFASVQDVPLRIYSGNLGGAAAIRSVGLQVVWLVVLVAAGRLLAGRAERRMVLQGG